LEVGCIFQKRNTQVAGIAENSSYALGTSSVARVVRTTVPVVNTQSSVFLLRSAGRDLSAQGTSTTLFLQHKVVIFAPNLEAVLQTACALPLSKRYEVVFYFAGKTAELFARNDGFATFEFFPTLFAGLFEPIKSYPTSAAAKLSAIAVAGGVRHKIPVTR